MKSFIPFSFIFLFFSIATFAQCTITSTTNASSLTCGSGFLSGCNGIVYIGNGVNPITISMNASLDLTCLGSIQLIIRNGATLDFSPGNNSLLLAAGSSLNFQSGSGLIGGSCNASERIKIGSVNIASCNGGGGATYDFSQLLSSGGYNVVNATITSALVCGSGSFTINAVASPSSGAVIKWYNVASNGTAIATGNSYTSPTLSSSTTYYVEATIGAVTTPRIAVAATVHSLPTTPIVVITPPTCTTVTGTITVTSPSEAGMTYSKDGTTYSNTTGIFSGVAAGTYPITAKNSFGCVSTTSSAIVAQTVATWNGLVWSTGSLPTSDQKIVFDGDYIARNDVTGCSCQVKSGVVDFYTRYNLILTKEISVSGGTLTFEDSSSLVQTNDAAVNSGTITYKRKTTPLKQYDYTYWSSPVTNFTLSQLGTNSLFFNYSPVANNWVAQSGSTTMVSGMGYIGRAPNNLNYSSPQIVETDFVGTPINGVVTVPIIKNTGTLNLIGNPYPSSISADLFLSDPANSSNVNGTIYLWTHNTAITNNNYTANDYAKYNLTGGVDTASTALSGGAIPTGKIASGQGFFIEANTALSNGSYTATFKDAMRISNSNNQFFKLANQSNTSIIEKHRIWISLSNQEGAYSESLIGYIEGATNGFDSLYDGKMIPSQTILSLYTMIGAEGYSIEGRSLPFDDSDVILLGYNATKAGEVTINLENFDGIFNYQNVYLYDKYDNSYTDLKAKSYTFTTAVGTFNDRFELRYTIPSLNTNILESTAENIKISTVNHQLIISSLLNTLSKIEIYDILGNRIYSKEQLNSNEYQTEWNAMATQVVIVKTTLENHETYTKKAIVN